jgi:hypothetical protein
LQVVAVVAVERRAQQLFVALEVAVLEDSASDLVLR